MHILRKLFGRYLLITNTVSCGLMMAAGDLIQQRREHWKKYRYENYFSSGGTARVIAASPEEDTILEEEKKKATDVATLYEHNYVRTRNMTLVGLIQGPFHHCFYGLLEKIAPGKKAKSIIKKTFLDQLIASPTCLIIFFGGLGLMERDKVEEAYREIKVKLIEAWKVDCCFWPPAQCVNFMFIPLQYRVLYINVMTMVYDVFLSYIKYDAHND
ncbi:PREDICTED: mpv17-like protein 2 [Polistes canadensis]|uniref:mpv17-like protein 2 n=1 Tax=Polistes canadensis TaxID=91411 RepID=UPI000718DEA9|nr:PREDICTED: mpv17-like protein 2 [Polistes canadensis]XP_014611237.1 PREDICTED: mpv17-like protein 2 [Polistes canadensis]XP_014611238.1 PREDICTED: mpv17-like protein 2 [Polistes canadensis]